MALTVTDEQLQAVAAYRREIGELHCGIEHLELALRLSRERLEPPDALPFIEGARILVLEAPNHGRLSLPSSPRAGYVKRNVTSDVTERLNRISFPSRDKKNGAGGEVRAGAWSVSSGGF